jgi:hypothetical protein
MLVLIVMLMTRSFQSAVVSSSRTLISIALLYPLLSTVKSNAKSFCTTYRVGRYFDILIYRDIFNRDYCIESRNLSDDISKLSSCSMTIVILLRMCI